ncbi:MAG: DUF4416 family protein [Planctomycetaceae bacterium]
MSKVRGIEPVIRFVAVITSDDEVRAWAYRRIAERWGETVESCAAMPFEAGGYYTAAMGESLSKTLIAVGSPVDPSGLADWKTETNRWEVEAAAELHKPQPRPLNLDPGYITQAKLVLATVKDRDHRIYLRDGIFGEVTLTYVGKQWVHHRWTYPDYRTTEVSDFAMRCRDRLRKHLLATGAFRLGKRE